MGCLVIIIILLCYFYLSLTIYIHFDCFVTTNDSKMNSAVYTQLTNDSNMNSAVCIHTAKSNPFPPPRSKDKRVLQSAKVRELKSNNPSISKFMTGKQFGFGGRGGKERHSKQEGIRI